jgi:hypothetical protein
MSAEEIAKITEQRIDVGGGTVVTIQPKEMGYTLRREEFDLLCEGEIDGDDKRWRDVCFATSMTAFIGLLSVAVAVDWANEATRKSWVVWAVTVILLAGMLASFGVFCYLLKRVKGHTNSSGYQRTRAKIRNFFGQQRD